jgi:hypothetical protein
MPTAAVINTTSEIPAIAAMRLNRRVRTASVV